MSRTQAALQTLVNLLEDYKKKYRIPHNWQTALNEAHEALASEFVPVERQEDVFGSEPVTRKILMTPPKSQIQVTPPKDRTLDPQGIAAALGAETCRASESRRG